MEKEKYHIQMEQLIKDILNMILYKDLELWSELIINMKVVGWTDKWMEQAKVIDITNLMNYYKHTKDSM